MNEDVQYLPVSVHLKGEGVEGGEGGHLGVGLNQR